MHFYVFSCGTHVLTRRRRGLRDPQIARGPQLCAKGLTLAPASSLAHAAFLSEKTTSRGPRRASGAACLHFDTVFTCFSRRTHVWIRKKRRAVMPRIAWGRQASATQKGRYVRHHRSRNRMTPKAYSFFYHLDTPRLRCVAMTLRTEERS